MRNLLRWVLIVIQVPVAALGFVTKVFTYGFMVGYEDWSVAFSRWQGRECKDAAESNDT